MKKIAFSFGLVILGIYAAGSASALDVGSTILLFGFALARMSLCFRRQPVPAKVIARRPSR
ncbi:MAG: hypothetical protein ACLQU4_19695 [Limisphaerales bacterium]